MLEYFVHLDPDEPPDDLVLAMAEVPENVTREYVEASTLPANWRESPAPAELAGLGDEFVQRAKHCLLVVPSALAATENNWLINPLHKDFKKAVVHSVEPLSYDSRMFPKQQGRRAHRK
jgi:RES domain-containing protein